MFYLIFEITIFLIFRKVYKNNGFSTLLKNSISTKIENTYKTNVFFIIIVIILTLFLLLLSVSRGGYAYAVRYAVRVRSTVLFSHLPPYQIQPFVSLLSVTHSLILIGHFNYLFEFRYLFPYLIQSFLSLFKFAARSVCMSPGLRATCFFFFFSFFFFFFFSPFPVTRTRTQYGTQYASTVRTKSTRFYKLFLTFEIS